MYGITPNGLQMKYFVLKPKGTDWYAQASREAMQTFADSCRDENPDLADDLELWISNELAQ